MNLKTTSCKFMVIWSAEITCKLGSLSWVTLRNFKIANLLCTKQKDRISLTPAEHMLLIFLHNMWVLELCASQGCNGAISQLLLTAVVCIPGLNTLSIAMLWSGDKSILLLNGSGSKGGNITVATSITLSYSTASTNMVQISECFLHISFNIKHWSAFCISQ